MSSFVHLHVHSEFSLLDGLSSPRALCKRAAELGQDTLALTDHGSMYGAVAFSHAAVEEGIKPILGCELYQAPRSMHQRDPSLDREAYHLVLLAMNEQGYQNLLKLVTLAATEGMYYRPRIDRELLAEYADGLICTSACLSGEVPTKLQQGDMDGAREAVAFYRDLFGTDRYFLELQQHAGIPELSRVNEQLVALSKEFSVRCIATNDVHYARKEDAAAQDLLLAIQTQTTLKDPTRMRMPGSDYHLRSAEEMIEALPEYREAIENTALVADMCNYRIEENGYHLPVFEVPDGHTSESYLRELCEAGLQRRYPEITPEVRERLEYELSVIHSMGFDDYFLINWDLVKWAKNQARMLVGPGRGSGPGSIVAYVLGITSLEPLGLDLIFERFLNPDRVNMPDIDLDYPEDRRGEVIEYLVHRYGEDKTAQIATFTTLGARAAIRDVGRAMDLDPAEVDYVAKLIPEGSKVHIEDAVESVAELRDLRASRRDIRELLDFATQVQGVARNFSTHAAGILISDKPLVSYTPLRPAPHGDGLVSQFCMEDVESIGLLKLDVLGLSTLTVLDRTFGWIEETEGIILDPESIPMDDPATYELLGSGDVTGVFQVESEGMRRTLRDMQPSEFRDIIAVIALFRPGPMDYIPSYINRKYGREPVTYAHPALEPILRDTYGIIVYQEQIIRIAQDLAGYSAGEADLMRRAVGKKKKKELDEQHAIFVRGAMENGIPRKAAEDIFADIERFANYGFNKAHGAAYAVITVQTAYLKAHYPAQFMCALLSVERGNMDKVSTLAAECRRQGIRLLGPNVNHSGVDFALEAMDEDGATAQCELAEANDLAIRFGLGAIKNCGDGPAQEIVDARGQEPFADIDDLVRRVDLRKVNRRALEALIRAGALDDLGDRGALLAGIDNMMTESSRVQHDTSIGQTTLFDLGDDIAAAMGGGHLLPQEFRPLSERQRLADERELLGVFVSSHPLDVLSTCEDNRLTEIATITTEMRGETVSVAGVVSESREILTRKGNRMAFVTLEDLTGVLEVVVFPRVFEEANGLFEEQRALLFTGRVDDRDDRAKLIADRIAIYEPPKDAPKKRAPRSRPRLLELRIPLEEEREPRDTLALRTLALLEEYRGDTPFQFRLVANGGYVRMAFPDRKVAYTPELERAINDLLGPGNLTVHWA
ncbi:MAG: DNA polymerase III subunit alpha [Anaerolineae bacterium]